MLRDLVEKITGQNYDYFVDYLIRYLFGPTGAQIIGWTCLILATFFLIRRRTASMGIIFILYFIAFLFAYGAGILKILKGK